MYQQSTPVTMEESLATINDKSTYQIGIIGMGDMGRLYASKFYQAGWTCLNVCDLPPKFDQLQSEFPQYNVLSNGHLVSRLSDLIIYSVEAKYIESAVQLYGPSTKYGAIVSGQTSVKAPEVAAFETYLPNDVHIIPVHSMHGPNVSPKSQPLVIINHRASKQALLIVKQIFKSSLGSKIVELTAVQHDKITADTQAVTHLAFKSMGTAWSTRKNYPWEDSTYNTGGVDNIKIAMMLRIYSNNWHLYAGLALLNPMAKSQIAQYAQSVNELFSLMIQENEIGFRSRVYEATKFVFGTSDVNQLLLADQLLDQYTLSSISTNTVKQHSPNSHLSLLAMIDCWHVLKINPFAHLIVQTPPFRLWLGIVEYIFKTPGLLDLAINAALYCKEIRADDLAFVAATAGWAQTIVQGHFDSYQHRFQETQTFFKDRLNEGRVVSAKIIETLTANMRSERSN